MEIRRYESDLLLSNMYLLIEKGHAIVIDPYRDTTPGAGLTIDWILLTHEHYDHISGVNDWKEATGAKVLCSNACAKNICDSKRNLSRHFSDFCELQTWVKLDRMPDSDNDYRCFADISFDNEMAMEWQQHEIKMFEIPGHSRGSIGIVIDNCFFFSGDSLMEKYEIELRMPGGSRKQWKDIGKPRIESLQQPLIVYPGHFKEFAYGWKGGK